jgi:hypothetical protein
MRPSKIAISRHTTSLRRLARECAKLDVEFEKLIADEGLAADLLEWPEY